MAQENKYIYWFKDLDKNSIAIVGGKGANLGEMTRAKFPVPPGFVVSADAYWDFLVKTGTKEHVDEILKTLNVNDNQSLQNVSKQIQKLIISQQIPVEISRAIKKAYNEMGNGRQETFSSLGSKKPDILNISNTSPFIAARSSATAEDLPTASFAGQQSTFLNVKGEDEVVKATQACWASLFTSRAIFYRENNNFEHMKVKIAVVIQKMVDAEKAGVAFSAHPSTGEQNIIIESAWGLGDTVVAGEVNPDRYIIDKGKMEIVSKEIKKKLKMKIKDPISGKTIEMPVPEKKMEEQVLTDSEIISLSDLISRIEKHYGAPQDIEWAIDNGRIFIVQSRAITTIGKSKKGPEKQISGGEKVLEGLAASPGVAQGKVKLIKSKDELDKIEQGDILVTSMTDPDMVPAMKRAGAIVTDEGGLTCHAAIVSREMGIPAIVGTTDATKKLIEGDIVTVDADRGVVYRGKIEIEEGPKKVKLDLKYEVPVTATKIYLNLGVPEKISEYKDLPIDGIGLMREEFIIASELNKHPKHMLETGSGELFIETLSKGIEKVARAVFPKPVVIRFSDFKTNEYSGLEGGEKFEPKEENPMIGWRGCSRYISPEFEGVFRMECKAISRVRSNGLKNVWVMLPFVRNIREVLRIYEIMKEEGLERNDEFKIWLMAEVPSIIFLADEFSKICDGFSIGSNDLTQLVLGVDRDSGKLGKMKYFDERDDAVKRAIMFLVDKAHENGVTVSICGQAPSVYPDFTKFLVKIGIDSVSVSPDVVEETRVMVASIERKVILDRATQLEREGLLHPEVKESYEAMQGKQEGLIQADEPTEEQEIEEANEIKEGIEFVQDMEDNVEKREDELSKGVPLTVNEPEEPSKEKEDMEYFDFSDLDEI